MTGLKSVAMQVFSENGFFAGSCARDGVLTVGGRVDLEGAVSPNNGLPLIQHASLRLKPDLFWIPKWTAGEIRFLYSWKCNIHLGDFSYRHTSDTVIVMEYQRGVDGAALDFPYADYPIAFEPVVLKVEPIPSDDQRTILALNADPQLAYRDSQTERLAQPRHQFGGTPYLLQGKIEAKHCIVCHEEMSVIASIGNEAYSDDRGGLHPSRETRN
jgi:hypothetical protein